MKNKFTAFAMLFMAVFTLASCLDDDTNYVYTDDSAITSFTVTGAKRYVYTKTKKGDEDSVYTVTSSYTSYKFNIDQNNNTISNPDSLPYGVDAKKLVCTVYGLNSANVYIKDLNGEGVSIVTTTDSLDFSVERELQVISNSGQNLRKYKVNVNVHKEQADSFFWTSMAKSTDIAKLTTIKTYAIKDNENKDHLFLFGSNGNNTMLYLMSNGQNWTVATPKLNEADIAFDANVCKSVVTKNDTVYICNNGNILRTTDGNTWEQTGNATGIKTLIAASPLRLYGYNTEGQLMASADNGATWTMATIDSDASLLPTSNLSYTCTALRTNNNSYRVTIYGTTAAGEMAIWSKIDEGDKYSENQPWAYHEVYEEDKHTLPKLKNMSVATYDDKTYALGTPDGMDASNATMYSSMDGGLTWAADTIITVPTEITSNKDASSTPNMAIAVDSNNFIWLVNAASGNTWRGRINRLGWKKEQTDFTE